MHQRALIASAHSFAVLASIIAPAGSHDQTGVLIVDHDRPSCLSLKLMFLDLGYRSTRTACSANRALALVDEFSPALVLLQLDLPGMSVYQLARRIRNSARENVARLDLIAVAPRGAHASGDLARAAGFDGYLAKPIRPAALNQLLHNLRL